jgi:hypothetical protein
MKSDIQNFREALPLSSNRDPLPPHMRTRIVGRPQQGPLMLERLLISGASSSDHDWIINDVEVDGISQFAVKDLPGALFSTRGIITGGRRAFSCLCFGGLDVIEQESEVAVTVTYVGSNPHGVAFFGAIVGDSPPQRPTILPMVTKNMLFPTVATTITAVLDQSLEISTLEIEDTGTEGGAADWIIHDIRIDGITQFGESGDVPGDMFSTGTIDNFVKFLPGTRVELLVTYIGLNKSGCCFRARLLGTVVRDNIEQPPPDVHAVLQVSGQVLDDKVVGRCNWRAPYVPSST